MGEFRRGIKDCYNSGEICVNNPGLCGSPHFTHKCYDTFAVLICGSDGSNNVRILLDKNK